MFKMYDSIEKYQIITLVYLMNGIKYLPYLQKEFAYFFVRKKTAMAGDHAEKKAVSDRLMNTDHSCRFLYCREASKEITIKPAPMEPVSTSLIS